MPAGMTPEERSWLLGHLLTGDARRVLALLTIGAGTAAFLAQSSGVGLAETRETLARALTLGLIEQHQDPATATTRYTITDAGRDHLAGPAPTPTPEITPVIDGNAAAIAVDDQPSSTAMTSTGRRGKPDWCTPGAGVCLACTKEDT